MSASGLTALFRLLIFRKQRSKGKRKALQANFLLPWNELASTRLAFIWSLLQKKLSDLRDCFPFDVCDQSVIVEIDRNYNWSISTWSQQSLNFFWSDRGNHTWKPLSGFFSCFVLHFGVYRPIFVITCGVTLPPTVLPVYGSVLLKLPQIKIDPASLGLEYFIFFLPENLSLFKLRHDSAFDSVLKSVKLKSQKINVITRGLLFLSKNNKSNYCVLPSSGKHMGVHTLLLIYNRNLTGYFLRKF